MRRLRSNEVSWNPRDARASSFVPTPETILIVCGALLALADGALAADVKESRGGAPGPPIITADCVLADPKGATQAFNPPATVPDNDPAGVTFGPIVLPDDQLFISHVVLALDCSHTWLGDLVVRLLYDENSDGVIDTSSTVIWRPGYLDGGGGCGSNLVTGAIYSFEDTTANSLPEIACNDNADIPGGCYRPTGFGSTPMAVFEGRKKGGRWWLFVSDNGPKDFFTLTSWSVYMLNAPVAVAPTSWGRLKLLYR